jgi:preprotein translocase subunit YajC
LLVCFFFCLFFFCFFFVVLQAKQSKKQTN